MKKVIIINGPGVDNAGSVNDRISRQADLLGITCDFFKSNSEGELVTAVQSAFDMDGAIINAAGYAGYSIAIRDAIASINKPVVEVRTQNVQEGGEHGQASVLAPVCAGSIIGFGAESYILALYALADRLGAKGLLD